MRSSSIFFAFLSISCSVEASVLNTTNIATVLAGVTDQTTLSIPKDAMTAISLLGTGGKTSSKLSKTDTVAIANCVGDARNNDTTTEGRRGTKEQIAHVSMRVTKYACESAGEQVNKKGSDDSINSLISAVGVLNANIVAAVKTTTKSTSTSTTTTSDSDVSLDSSSDADSDADNGGELDEDSTSDKRAIVFVA